jgi:hypothetical protein
MAYTLTAAAATTGSKNGLGEWLVDPAELLAVLRIVGDEAHAHGVCALHIDAIAARAGVGQTTVQNALREARDLGLVTVQEPAGDARRANLEWRTWLRLKRRFKKSTTAIEEYRGNVTFKGEAAKSA